MIALLTQRLQTLCNHLITSLGRPATRSWSVAGAAALLVLCLILGLESGQKLMQAKPDAEPSKPVAKTVMTSTAIANTKEPASALRIVGADPKSVEVQSILSLISQLQSASNAHDLDTLLSFYSKEFVSGDNLDLKQVRALVADTWSQYPDIRYNSDLLEVRLNGNWATVESLDHTTAIASNEAQLPGQTGTLNTESRSLLFLRRIGKTWTVESDYTVYETARILFGEANGLNVQLAAPDQVFSGESYTARLSLNIPSAYFAIAGISKEKLVFPQTLTEDKFRTLSPDNSRLERVFESNAANKNEIVTATIGLTQIGRDDKQRPTVALKGIATIVKRINVLPRPHQKNMATSAANVAVTSTSTDEVVHSSADGRTVIGSDQPQSADTQTPATDGTNPPSQSP